MRLRHVPKAAEIVAGSPYVLSLDALTAKRAAEMAAQEPSPQEPSPLHVEIGTGKGQFLIEMAKRHPEVCFLGVERYESVLYKACEKMDALAATGAAPDNLRFLSADARELPSLFAPASVDKLYLNFSDPWPKERHAKRRLTSPQFLAIYAQILKDGARLQMKTDQAALFDYSLETLTEDPHWEITAVVQDLHKDEARMAENVMTEYERKFSALGSRIRLLTATFRKADEG